MNTVSQEIRLMVDDLPKHPIESIETPTPANGKAAVYILWKDDELYYVGQSTYLARRLFQHQHTATTHYSFIPVPTKSRFWIETLLIKALKPSHNFRLDADAFLLFKEAYARNAKRISKAPTRPTLR